MMEDKDLNRCVAPLAGSEPLCSTPFAIDDARLKLTMGNNRNPDMDLASVGSPSSSRQGLLWKNQYDLASLDDSLFQEENFQVLSRVREEFAMQNKRGEHFSNKHVGPDKDEMSAHTRFNDENKIILSNGLVVGNKKLKTISRSSFSQLLVKKKMKGKEIVTKYPEVYSASLDQNNERCDHDAEVASTADLKTGTNTDQNHSHGILRSLPDSYGNEISLREWLKCESHKVHKAERLLIFKQIVQLVEFAHSQGSALLDLRPTCFIVLPSNKIQYIGSLVLTDTINSALPDLNKKRQAETNANSSHSLSAKQQKLSEAMRSLRNQPKIGKETESYMAVSQAYGCREPQVQKDSSYRNTPIVRQQQSIAVPGQLENQWYTCPEGLDERGCSLSSNIYGLGVLLFEVRRHIYEMFTILFSFLKIL